MKGLVRQHSLLGVMGLALGVAAGTAPAATVGTWAVDASSNWSTATNWDTNPSVPSAAGDTANLTYDITAGRTVTVDTPETVGILNIGVATTAFSYNVNNSGGATLTMNNGGGAQINELSTSNGDTINLPLVLADNLTISAASTTGGLSIQGSITGTGNLTFATTGGHQTTVSANINNVGQLLNTSTSGTTRFQGGVGSNVTQIVNNGTAQMYFAGAGITVNSGGTTLINNSTGSIGADGGLGPVGTGNFTVDNNGSGGLQIGGANNIGELILNGTYNNGGNDTQTQVGPIGSNVTEVIQQSAVTAVGLRNGSMTVNAAGSTLVNTGGALLALKQSVTGTGNLIFQNDSSVNDAVQFAEQTANQTGLIINSGTGTGESYINDNGHVGASVTGITQESATSALRIRGDLSAYVGTTTITAGTVYLAGPTGNYVINAPFVVGDTAAHGAGSVLDTTGQDSHLFQLGGSLSGFGTVKGNVQLEAGATLKPGDRASAATLALNNNVTLATGGNLNYYLNTPASSALALISGTLTIGENEALTVTPGGSFGAGTYYLLDSPSAITDNSSNFTGWTASGLPGGLGGQFILTTDPSNSYHSVALVVSSIPEPASLVLVAAGGLLLAAGRRQRD